MSPPRARGGGRRRGRAGPDAAGAEHLVRSTSWNGVRRGDPVEVAATGIRSATWEFRSHVTNRRNGAEWVEVVGGRPGDRRIRTFPPERIYPASARRKASAAAEPPTLADAPQLPLG